MAGNYGGVQVPDLPGGATIVVIPMGAAGDMPVSCIVDDPAFTAQQSPARVKNTTPDGTENGLVVRTAVDGAQGTGLNPPTGGSGLLGFLSGIYSAIQALATALTSTGIASSPAVTGTATLTRPPCSATSVVILAANASRKAARILNDTASGFGNGAGQGAYLYLLWGSGTASPGNCNEIVAPGQSVAIPANFVGAVQGVWAGSAIGGNALVTEFTT